ncbi:DsbA family oxidoreductase [Streptomyces sp. NBC_01497]|uniref:DsbA family oxidoreductase n=1 Tax=Streptomyces sp. NBC_01497 TaxID=2903885 RepID=UPI002E375C17|nr:DsbA family protein [Streptomyces sp. NBC_01497]
MSIHAETVAGSPSRVVTADHWFDFLCPYCYIGQDRNRILRERGINVVGHPLEIHPEIGPGGTPAGPRQGPTYVLLAQEAEAAGLPLRWSDRIPYSRPALAAYAWLRESEPEAAEPFASSVFAAYFGNGRDIESEELLLTLADGTGGDAEDLRAALASGSASAALAGSEVLGWEKGVASTPTWLVGAERVSGLRPRTFFETWPPRR